MNGFIIPFGPYAGWVLDFDDPLLPFQANMLGYAFDHAGEFIEVAHIHIVPVWEEYSGDGVRIGTVEWADFMHSELFLSPYFSELHDFLLEYTSTFHGTLTTGIFGAAANNDMGFVGVAYGASIAGTNVVGARQIAGPSFAQLDYTLFDVINASAYGGGLFVGSGMSAIYSDIAIERSGLGAILVKSAGNYGADDASVNAQFDAVFFEQILVGRTFGDGITHDSDFGANVHITAPLVSAFDDGLVISTDNVGDAGRVYATGSASLHDDYSVEASSLFSRYTDAGYDLAELGLDTGNYYLGGGTSSTAPIVTGVVALMLEAAAKGNVFTPESAGGHDLGWRDVQEILALSARHTGSALDAGYDDLHYAEHHPWTVNGADILNGGGLHHAADYGFGMVDAHAAIRLVETWQLTRHSDNLVTQELSRSVGGQEFSFGNPIELTFEMTGDTLDLDVAQIQFQMGHDVWQEIQITLISPDGTESIVIDTPWLDYDYENNTYSPDWIHGVEFDWLATSRVFWGEASSGTWTIVIEDMVDNDNGGYVNDMTLILKGDLASEDDTYYFTSDWSLMNAYNGGVPTLSDAVGDNTINAAPIMEDISLKLAPGSTAIIGGDVAFRLSADAVFTMAIGGDGDDTLVGSVGDETLYGMRGNDTIWAGAGDMGSDAVYGGKGHDLIGAGAGDDLVVGGYGKDTLFGGSGDDTLVAGDYEGGTWVATTLATNSVWGGSGSDQLYGDRGNDTLGGGLDGDYLFGSAAHDILFAGKGDGADTLDGGAGEDTLYGGGGDDVLFGSGGNDLVFNGAGADSVDGGDGDDTLWGGGGDDTLTGGAGADVFAFGASNGNDTITDFDVDSDILDLRAAGITDASALADLAVADGQNVTLMISNTLSITLTGITISDLDELTLITE